MKTIVLVFFIAFGYVANAQFSSEVWHDGFLVTNDQDTLRGQVKYNMEANSIQFYNEEIIRTFSSFQVLYFNIFDQILDNYRQFYCIPYKLKYDYETPIIFELLFEGALSLLAREAIVQESVPTGASIYSGSIVRDKVALSYFFVDKKGKMIPYNGKKSNLFEIMESRMPKVKDYVKKNKLKSDSPRDLVRITAFYNSI